MHKVQPKISKVSSRLLLIFCSALGSFSALGQGSTPGGEEQVQTWALQDLAFAAQRNSAVPPLSQNLESQRTIMLTLSVDHQLFFEAYNAYDDIYKEPGELYPVPETTYTHKFKYVGYYDPHLCYAYSDGLFAARSSTDADGYCVDGADAEGGWSGNFLNWATMTRMDLVRFVLYGGYRHIDEGPGVDGNTAARTVLERSYLPQDAHSFAKYYAGDDIAKLTSISVPACTGTAEQCAGYTFCNTTQPDLTLRDSFSQDAGVLQKPPLMRVVKGDYSLWASNERYQCVVAEEVPAGGWDTGQGRNGNLPAATGIRAFGDAPSAAQIADYFVRVNVCQAQGAVRESFCRMYSANSYKPVGLLQEQGESGDVKFGLITGSYNANKSFGALRKNISSFSEEVNPDGTFVFPSLKKIIDDGGLPDGFELTNSIIGNLNALRIVDYKFIAGGDSDAERSTWQGTYNDTCFWGQSSFNNGECRNWGNPFSELLAESYLYYARRDKMAFGENDQDLIPGLSVAEWNVQSEDDTGEFACPNMNVIGFNASSVSYDAEQQQDQETSYRNLYAKTTTLLFGAGVRNSSVLDLTDVIGANELEDKQYFVGEVNGVNSTGDGQCTAKTITGKNLSLVSGTCPEAPNSKGGYWGAGLAHFVHTNDVLPSSNRKDTISTYGITLAGALPNITVAVPPTFNRTIQIIPACRNLGRDYGNSGDDVGNCALVNFIPVEVFAERPVGSGTYTGKYYVGWEDSEQGGDFDLDLGGSISFAISQSEMAGAQLSVTTQIISESAADIMEFGFIISGTGTARDRAYFPSKITQDDQGGVDEDTRGTDCTDANRCTSAGQVQTIAFDLGEGDTAEFLKSPLYYASKWGSFNDKNGNGLVDDGEWDGSGYAEVSDPSRLREQLAKVIDNIIDKPVAGTGAAVATTALTGEGLILSTLFMPSAGEGAATVDWVGRLNGLFRAYGETWEDNDSESPGVRTDDDYVVRFYADEGTGSTVFDRYKAVRDEYGAYTFTLFQEAVPYSELMPIWNARDQLAAIPQEGTSITLNRPYRTSASSGRHILTSIDVNNDGHTMEGRAELVEFVSANFGGTASVGLGENNFRFLDVESTNNAEKVVDFIRGKEGIEGFRNRTVSVTKSIRTTDGLSRATVEMPWLLGDIAHSTPALVGRPNKLFDTARINDQSYSVFREAYANRRLVAYVGANDGMLHAFNAGFAGIDSKAQQQGDAEVMQNRFTYRTLPDENAGGKIPHPLGAELWAYVPYNLLPQLKWLTDPNYRHVYYVDSNVNQFDVNIFEHSDTHPEGWGSIIVVGMRLGGSDVAIDADGDPETDPRNLRSAYMIFDVTDPEQPPKLLGEISDPRLGYTMGDIDIISFRDPHVTGSYRISEGAGALPKNKWYLVFGSGPHGSEGLSKANSDQNAKLFTLDLNKLAARTAPQVDLGVIELRDATKSYVGGLTAMDWNDDFDDDMIYFGTVGTGALDADPRGALMQAELRYNANADRLTITPSKLLTDVNLPFSREPLNIKESAHNGYWVYATSGKFVVREDLTGVAGNRAFGIRVNSSATGGNSKPWLTTTGVEAEDLLDISEYSVTTDVIRNDEGDVIDRTFAVTSTEGIETTPAEVSEDVRRHGGWVKDFSEGELANTRPFYSGSTLGLATFLPKIDGCSPSGGANLYVLNLFNGLAQTENASFLGSGGSVHHFLDDYTGAVDDRKPIPDGPVLDVPEEGGEIPILPKADGSSEQLPFDRRPARGIRTSWREISTEDLN